MIKDCKEIIDLPYVKSKNHPHMSSKDRAAQFAPFAALTGYDETINEVSRLTDESVILSEDQKIELDLRISELTKSKAQASFTYFIGDSRKKGGSYHTVTCAIKKVEKEKDIIVFDNNLIISFDSLIKIE